MLTVQTVKLYPTKAQAEVLSSWMRCAAKVWNHFLEQRIKAWERRQERVGVYSQCATLKPWRVADAAMAAAPHDALGEVAFRLQKAFDAFFRRVKAGGKPGFPRFKSGRNWSSIVLKAGHARLVVDDCVRIPKLGTLTTRGLRLIDGKVKSIRVIRRASGWFAQLLIDDGKSPPAKREIETVVGVDVGIESFATLSTGEQIPNPRHGRVLARQLKLAQRKLARRQKRSRRRERQRIVVAKVYGRIAAKRSGFAHKLSRRLVSENDLIAVEKLNIAGLARGRLSKSVYDAAWSIFIGQLRRKAENAGATLVEVDCRGTSQECSGCGHTEKKSLSQRRHICPCGVDLHRDHNAAKVVLSRAMGSTVKHVERPPVRRRRKTAEAVLR